VSGEIHALAALLPGERAPSTHCIGSCMGLSAGLYVINIKVKLSLCFFLTKHHATKVYWGVEIRSTHS
jgi:hypothetical protein